MTDTGTGELIKRLRGRTLTILTNGQNIVEPDPDCQEAADALEAATKLIEEYVPVTDAADWLSRHATGQKGGDDE